MKRTNSDATTILSDTDFATPVEDRYFEDYVPGAVYVYGSITMTREDILRFADEFDPQSIHNDPQAAQQGPFSGLIASGRHTCSVTMRMYVDHYVSQVASLASPGIDELRWVQPVRPGDSLSLRATVQEARISRSKPDRGLVTTGIEVLNQDGQTVPTARAIAATSSSALPSSASLTDPEVSITTQTRGGVGRRLGSSTPGTAAERRDGRR